MAEIEFSEKFWKIKKFSQKVEQKVIFKYTSRQNNNFKVNIRKLKDQFRRSNTWLIEIQKERKLLTIQEIFPEIKDMSS